MPGSRLYNFSLAQPQFEIQPFQAVAFEPRTKADISILTKSFDKIEQRYKTLADEQAALDVTFSKLADSLYLGKNKNYTGGEQAEWFRNFQNKYKDKIKGFVDTGDVAGAINMATKLAGEAVNDPELKARMDASDKYSKYIETAETNAKQKGAQDLFNWWRGKHGGYSFSAEYDENGNFVTADDWEPDAPFYEPFQPAVDAKVAFEFFNPDTRSTSTRSSVSNSKTVDGTGSSTSRGSSSSRSLTKVTVDDLKAIMPDLKASSPDGMAAVDQRYEWECDRYNDLNRQIEEAKEYNPEWLDSDAGKRAQFKLKEYGKFILNENGVIDGIEGYWARTLLNEPILKALAYTKLDIATGSEISNSRTVNTDPTGSRAAVAQQRSIDEYNKSKYNSDSYTVEGELVGKQVTPAGQGTGVLQTQYIVNETNNTFGI